MVHPNQIQTVSSEWKLCPESTNMINDYLSVLFDLKELKPLWLLICVSGSHLFCPIPQVISSLPRSPLLLVPLITGTKHIAALPSQAFCTDGISSRLSSYCGFYIDCTKSDTVSNQLRMKNTSFTPKTCLAHSLCFPLWKANRNTSSGISASSSSAESLAFGVRPLEKTC